MSTNKKNTLIDIYVGSPWEAKHIKNLLQSANLNAIVKEEISGKDKTTPFSAQYMGNFVMKVFVPQEHYANALRIVSDYKYN